MNTPRKVAARRLPLGGSICGPAMPTLRCYLTKGQAIWDETSN